MSMGKLKIHYCFLLRAAHPLSLKGRSRQSQSKCQRVMFEGYYASLFIVGVYLHVIELPYNST